MKLRKLIKIKRLQKQYNDRKKKEKEIPADLYDENAGYGGWGGPW